jgi:hypothetical protein
MVEFERNNRLLLAGSSPEPRKREAFSVKQRRDFEMKEFSRLSGVFLLVVMGVLTACGGGGGRLFSPPVGIDPIPDTPTEESTDFGEATMTPAQAGGWSTETVDSPGNIGWQTSIDVSPDAASPPQVRISYYEQILKDLKVASGAQGGPWALSTLDSPNDVGKYNSLVWDGFAPPQVTYYRQSTMTLAGQLKAHQGIPVGVDPLAGLHDLGLWNDVTHGTGFPVLHASYTGIFSLGPYVKRAQLKHSYFDGASWSTDLVEEGSLGSGQF